MWEDKHGLLQLINQFHLLPTTQGTLRKMQSRILLPITGPKGDSTMSAWGMLGIGFLHPSVVSYISAFQHVTVAANNIPFLISSISSSNISGLDRAFASLIQEHLAQAAQGASVRLDNQSRQKFLQLPIFPTRVPIPDPKGGRKPSRREVGPAAGTLIYMCVGDSCPVPIPGDHTTFFDVVPRSGVLGTIIDITGMKRALDEVGVLEMAIDRLATQPIPILDALLDRIIRRLADLSDSARRKLHDVPFVPVVGRTGRIAPSEVIDPRSKLASLYEGEPGKLPSGRWAKEPYLSLLSSHGYFRREVTAEIVDERITYLATTWSAADHPHIFAKARKFLGLLDESWQYIHPPFNIANNLTKPWMPIQKDSPLAAPSQSRDKGETIYLFDLVLSAVNGRVHNEALRRSLGWDSVPTRVLQDQLQRALTHAENRLYRLHAIITELSRRTLTDEEIESLKATVSNHPWVPVQEEPPVIVETRHALLRSESTLRGRFKVVPRSLLKGRGIIFFQQMGCTERSADFTLYPESHLT
jgi:hypothetical protein